MDSWLSNTTTTDWNSTTELSDSELGQLLSSAKSDQLSFVSDVKRGQNFEAEAEANFWRLRPRSRPKIIMKKVPNND